MNWWRKSTFSAADAGCAEVMRHGQLILVRNSKDPNGPMVSFNLEEWDAFVKGMKDGQFDIPARV